MKKFIKKTCVFILAALIVCTCVVPVLAAEKKETLKVGFYPLKGFFDYDESGKEVGYGVDMLNEIGKQLGYEFDYVHMDSWSDNSKSLIDGKIDFYLPVTVPEFPNAEIDYTKENILNTYYVIIAPKENVQLRNADKKTIQNLEYAVANYTMYNTDMKSYLAKYGIGVSNVTFKQTHEECISLMESGKVDAVIADVMDCNTEKEQILDCFYSTPNIAAFPKNSKYIYSFDKAVSEIKETKPDFFDNLYKKYFPERKLVPISNAEQTALDKIKGICFYFEDNYGYMSDVVDGKFVGIMPEVAKNICKKMGVDYHFCSDQHAECDDDNYIHCDGNFITDEIIAKEHGVVLSDPVLHVQYNKIIQKNSKAKSYKNSIVALVENNTHSREFISKKIPKENVLWFESTKDCLNAVANGFADMAILNNYISDYYLNMYRYGNLTQVPIKGDQSISIGIHSKNNSQVSSVINKALDSLSDNEMSNIIISESSRLPKQSAIDALIYRNSTVLIVVILFLLMALIITVFMTVYLRKLRSKNQALSSVTKAKEQFFSQLSHDIRTPMNGILGSADLVKNSDDIEKHKEAIKDITQSGQFMMTLLNDVLDLSKINDSNFTLNLEPYIITEFERTISAIIMPRAREKGVCLKIINQITNPKYIMLDKIRLQQIVVNLLSNAIKFTPQGGCVNLIISAETLNADLRELKIIVSDSGIGMSEDFIKNKLYNEFEQERTSVNGTGLGLSIVKKLVDKMEGTITCKSELDKGTTFTVVICAKITENIPILNKEEPNLLTDSLEGKRILLCEDHPLNIKVATRILEKKNMIVETAENGKIGLNKFINSANGYFDVILMDIRMPEMDGLTATMEIRKSSHPQAKTIPIVAMSANALEEDFKKSKEAGMNEHLIKPMEPQALYNALVRNLQG